MDTGAGADGGTPDRQRQRRRAGESASGATSRPSASADPYAVQQRQALREALAAGDTDQADRILAHLIAEGTTSPQGTALLEQQVRAAQLFKAGNEAAARGDRAAADAALATMQVECSPTAIKTALAAALMRDGLRAGLPPAQHGRLMLLIHELGLGPQIRAMAATIRRRRR